MHWVHQGLSILTNFIMNMRFTDFIDIAIVAYLVYMGIKLIRETRAGQLLKGLILLIVATQISQWLQLNTINFILRNAMQLGMVALLVVFQPELRRLLEKMGRTSFSNLLNIDIENYNMADEVVDAADALSKEHIGALIVFERSVKLGDITRTGTQLNALITTELLINIFMVNTPLHDGAVIFSEGRLAAAGCLLPLTQNENLSRELGTRHRAALGVSESSDAIAVIVSEETGKISIAANGNIMRNLSVETLKKAIEAAVRPPARSGKSLINLWRERLKW